MMEIGVVIMADVLVTVDGTLEITNLGSKSSILRLVKLALAAGLPDVGLKPVQSNKDVVIRVRPVCADGSLPLPALLAVTSAALGTSPEKMIDDWRSTKGKIFTEES